MDKGICPYCKKDFTVMFYGRRISCPKCRKLIDIFPEIHQFGSIQYSVHLFCQDAQFQAREGL